ncbi:YqzE family protein [Bacillus shivajii]|uniref:YqzE family protein n=1 Tax=Bacillus shivajii TaxID=1983719 RepID=UPI001CFC1D0F|nr:YqzE family protein [Bacillus shivajii]UCZ54578.1 YqzE family protein [Bacillus shivajii]
MKTNDYVKFMTQQFVSYVDQPKEERLAKKQQKKELKEPRSYRWFGLIPMSLSVTAKKLRKK